MLFYPKSREEANFGADAVVVRDVADELARHMRAIVDLRAPLHPLESEATAELILKRKLLPALIRERERGRDVHRKTALWLETENVYVEVVVVHTNPFVQGIFHQLPSIEKGRYSMQ